MSKRTLEVIRAEIDALEAEYAALRENEMSEAREQVKRLMMQYGLTPSDLAGLNKASKKGTRAPHKPLDHHYVGPEGQVWKVRGPQPPWLKGLDKEKFKRAGSAPQ